MLVFVKACVLSFSLVSTSNVHAGKFLWISFCILHIELMVFEFVLSSMQDKFKRYQVDGGDYWIAVK